MPIVDVNGKEIEFPDDMSPEQIKGVLRQKFPIEQKPNIGRAASAAVSGFQGLTGGLGEEIRAGIGALPLSAASYLSPQARNVNPAEAYKMLYQKARGETEAARQNYPIQSIGAEIAGTIPTAAALGATKAGMALTNWLGRGGTVTKAAKAYTAAVPTTAAYLAADADGTLEERGQAALKAPLYALAAPAAVGAGAAISSAVKGSKNIIKGAKARPIEELDDVVQSIKDRGSQAYAKMREIGAVFSPQATQNIEKQLATTLAKDGALNPRLHDKVLAVFDDIQNATSKGAIGLEELDQWRQVLGDIAGNFSDRVNARKANLLINSIDDVVENVQPNDLLTGGKDAVEALKLGRQEWARQSKFKAITDIVRNADGDAYKLKRDLEKFLANPKKHRGFNKEEMDALKFAARQTTGEGLLKMVGKFGYDIGTGRAVGNTALPTAAGLAAALGTGGTGAGVLVPVVGTAARQGQKLLARGKVENLLNVIENGGKITKDMINKLPAKEKSQLLKAIMQMPVAKASAIFGTQAEKVK